MVPLVFPASIASAKFFDFYIKTAPLLRYAPLKGVRV